MEEISKQLEERKTEAALRWARDHKFEISKESNLLFLLHQINMREMLAKAVNIQYAIKYSHLEDDQEMGKDEKKPDAQAYNE